MTYLLAIPRLSGCENIYWAGKFKPSLTFSEEWQIGIFLVKILFVIVYMNKQLYLNLFTKDEAHNLSNQSNHTSTAKSGGRQAFVYIDFSGTIHLLLSSMAEWQGTTSGILTCIVDKCHAVSFLQHCYHDCRITENFS